ncbi:ProQ/FINO family protein [Pantoea sp. CCBC3-3-1]|uniref:ProQ/FINO family protein n=1 Tax=Pantoea sp. CCBC3-3-1 TaxID=2490851 RepID=UPI0011BD8B40|nr:ProQ/FINO family protein [Pantoea sp. CCBC3-3-1]
MTQQAADQHRKPHEKFKPRTVSCPPQATHQKIKDSFRSQGTSATRKKNRSQRRLVQELFPALFVGNYPLPMKSGIKDDMLKSIVRRGLDVSEERLQASLRACCASLVYRTRLFMMRYRRNIDGQPVEVISQDDRKHAWQQLVEYRKQHKLPSAYPSWFTGARKKGPNKGRSKPQRGMKVQKG